MLKKTIQHLKNLGVKTDDYERFASAVIAEAEERDLSWRDDELQPYYDGSKNETTFQGLYPSHAEIRVGEGGLKQTTIIDFTVKITYTFKGKWNSLAEAQDSELYTFSQKVVN